MSRDDELEQRGIILSVLYFFLCIFSYIVTSRQIKESRKWNEHQNIMPMLIVVQSVIRVVEAVCSAFLLFPHSEDKSFSPISYTLNETAGCFYFMSMLLLITFWARVHYQIFFIKQEEADFLELAIKVIQYSFSGTILLLTCCVSILIFSESDHGSEVAKWNRRFTGVISLVLAVFFSIFGVKTIKRFSDVSVIRSKDRLKQSKQITWVTIVCVSAFTVRGLADLTITTDFGDDVFNTIPNWIFDGSLLILSEYVPCVLLLFLVNSSREKRTRQNSIVMGMGNNQLMLQEELHGEEEEHLYDKLYDIIDSEV